MLYYHIISWRLDAAAMVVVAVGAMLGVHIFLRRRHGGRGVSSIAWAVLAAILVLGVTGADFAGRYEKARLRSMLEGIAPTYAMEIERLGHAFVGLETAADDPTYLAMIEAQKRWEKANRQVSDIYTFRAGPGDDVVLIVDAETDYDRNGLFEGEREQRTDIGEVYPETTPNMLRALRGEHCFDAVPVADRWGTWISAFAPLHDEDGNVEAALGVDYDAKAYVVAVLQMRSGALGMAAVLVAIMISATMLVQVTRAEMIRRTAAETERDQMRHELLLSSHKAGMAEISSGVLHNIGNAMNSVCVSATVIGEKLRMSKASALARLAGLVREHREDLHTFLTEDLRGKEIPDYLSNLADHMLTEQADMLAEVTHLNCSLDGISRVIETQQQSAKSAQVADVFEMAALLDNVVRSVPLEKHRVEVIRRYGGCRAVVGNPIKVQQILANLISNARQALMAVEGARQIVLTLEQIDGDDGGCVRVVVADNGVGISRDHQAKIFNHGFTTRPDGHGFGLHWSAITARQIGGNLEVASEGAGQGAAFIFDIPTTMKEVPV